MNVLGECLGRLAERGPHADPNVVVAGAVARAAGDVIAVRQAEHPRRGVALAMACVVMVLAAAGVLALVTADRAAAPASPSGSSPTTILTTPAPTPTIPVLAPSTALAELPDVARVPITVSGPAPTSWYRLQPDLDVAWFSPPDGPSMLCFRTPVLDATCRADTLRTGVRRGRDRRRRHRRRPAPRRHPRWQRHAVDHPGHGRHAHRAGRSQRRSRLGCGPLPPRRRDRHRRPRRHVHAQRPISSTDHDRTTDDHRAADHDRADGGHPSGRRRHRPRHRDRVRRGRPNDRRSRRHRGPHQARRLVRPPRTAAGRRCPQGSNAPATTSSAPCGGGTSA